VDDPAINLAIVDAVLSSTADLPIDAKTCFSGEVGLNGEIRPVPRIEQRIAEADKLGFTRMFLSKYNLKGIHQDSLKVKLIPLSKIEKLTRYLFDI
jgi:DNA repair protein RadA/Sms